MHTEIEMDDALVSQLMTLTGATAKRQVVHEASRVKLKWEKPVAGTQPLQRQG